MDEIKSFFHRGGELLDWKDDVWVGFLIGAWFCSWMLKGCLHLLCLHPRVILRICCFRSICSLNLAAQIPPHMSDRFSEFIYILWIREPSPSPLSPERISCSSGTAVFHPGYPNGAACLCAGSEAESRPSGTTMKLVSPHVRFLLFNWTTECLWQKWCRRFKKTEDEMGWFQTD